MPEFHLSVSDVQLILEAIDIACDHLASNPNPAAHPVYLIERYRVLQKRFALGLSPFTEGELKNVCLALDLLLEIDPMDWNASRLLSRIQAYIGSVQN